MKNPQVLRLAMVLVASLGVNAVLVRRAEAQSQDSTQTAIDHFDELTLGRTSCYGRCPIYRIVIHGDGTVEYEGMRFVKVVGRATTQLSGQQIAQLVNAINEARYFSLRDKYSSDEDGCPMLVTDSPSAITSVSVGAAKKSIIHYYGCMEPYDLRPSLNLPEPQVFPRELTALETRIDEIIGTVRWVGTGKEAAN